MGKTKHAKDDEFYKAIIRQQKKELKKLNQKIRQLEKELNYNQNKTTYSPKEKREEPKCFECGKGELRIMDIGIRRYTICLLCNHRERID